LAYGGGTIAGSFIAFALGTTRDDVVNQHLSWGLLAAQMVLYLLVLPSLLLLLPWLSRMRVSDLGMRWPNGRTVGIGLAGAVAMYAVTIAIANLQFAVTHQKPEEAVISMFAGAHDLSLEIAFVVLAVVLAPFVEELTFRGFFFNALLRYTPVWVAAVISGCVFGLTHGSLSAFLPLAGSGVVLAYVYYLTGSLPASMITHATFNAINVALIALGKV
jgi:membrane protease YdiL (CAAX protease family)